MKNNFYILLTFLLLINGCNERENKPLPSPENENKSITKISTLNSSQNFISTPIPKPIKDKKVKKYSFIFENLKNKKSIIEMENDLYHFKNIQQPIVMIVLFSTWCPPCRGEIPHLTNLQKKFKKNLFILGALVHDDIKNEPLQKLIIAEKALFFISTNQKENLKFSDMITPKLKLEKEFPMPLMILFKNGKYFTHYEGNMPEEMIESDIRQLLEQIKKG